jgi:hypothetical protein
VPKGCSREDLPPFVPQNDTVAVRDVVSSTPSRNASIRTKAWDSHTAWPMPRPARARPPELRKLRNDPDELVNVTDQ